MANLDTQQIEKDIAKLASALFQQFTQQAIRDGEEFASETQANILELALNRSQMTVAEFEDGKRDIRALARMERIKQQGLAKVAVDRFTSGVIDIVLEAAEAAV